MLFHPALIRLRIECRRQLRAAKKSPLEIQALLGHVDENKISEACIQCGMSPATGVFSNVLNWISEHKEMLAAIAKVLIALLMAFAENDHA